MATLTAVISANGDDGQEYDGVWYIDGDAPGSKYAGKYFGPVIYMADRFQVPTIANTATINTATWRLYANGDQVGTPLLEIKGDDVDNSAQPSGSAFPSARTLTTASTSKSLTAGEWGSAGWVTVNVTTIIAEIIARSGWAAGNYISLFMYGTAGSGGTDYVGFEDYSAAGTNHSELVIDYTPAGAAALEGNAAGNATATGSLSTGIQMSGAASGEATATGELTGPAALAGAATGNAAASGTMITWTYVTVASPDTGPGSIFDSRYWTGAAPANGDLIAYDASGGFEVLPNGQYSATGYGSWVVQFAYAATPSDWAASIVTISQTDFAADSFAIATAAGALTTAIQLAGAAAAEAMATGSMAGDTSLAGAAAALATAVGALSTAIQLAGDAAAVASASGDMNSAPLLAGDAAGQATAEGTLTTGIPLAGDAAGQATATGDMFSSPVLAGDAAGESTAGGDITTAIQVAGDAVGQAAAGGVLSDAAAPPAAYPFRRTITWDDRQTPELVIGDTFQHLITLKSNGSAFDVSAAASVKARVVTADHSDDLTDTADMSSAFTGANWSVGQVMLYMPGTVTMAIAESIQREALAKVEIQVELGADKFSWFGVVRVLPGFIA